MNSKKGVKGVVTGLLLIGSLVLCGCSLRKQIDNMPSVPLDETIQSMDMGDSHVNLKVNHDLDWDRILSLFYGMTEQEMEQYRASPEYRQYEEGSRVLAIAELSDMKINSIYYRDNRYGIADCYELIMDMGNFNSSQKINWKIKHPEKELESCSIAEALEKCQPYVESIGYKDYEVTVYTITYEYLTTRAEYLKGRGFSATAPNLEFEAEPDYADYDEWEVPWTKEDEAYFLYYEPYINGYLVESDFQGMIVLYVPKYDSIVYILGNLPLVEDGKSAVKETQMITSEYIIKELMLSHWVMSADNMEIKEVSLVPSLVSEGEIGDDIRWKIMVSWKVTYRVLGEMMDTGYKTVYFDAATGKILGNN